MVVYRYRDVLIWHVVDRKYQVGDKNIGGWKGILQWFINFPIGMFENMLIIFASCWIMYIAYECYLFWYNLSQNQNLLFRWNFADATEKTMYH